MCKLLSAHNLVIISYFYSILKKIIFLLFKMHVMYTADIPGKKAMLFV